jgi:hypothetical protein
MMLTCLETRETWSAANGRGGPNGNARLNGAGRTGTFPNKGPAGSRAKEGHNRQPSVEEVPQIAEQTSLNEGHSADHAGHYTIPADQVLPYVLLCKLCCPKALTQNCSLNFEPSLRAINASFDSFNDGANVNTVEFR